MKRGHSEGGLEKGSVEELRGQCRGPGQGRARGECMGKGKERCPVLFCLKSVPGF